MKKNETDIITVRLNTTEFAELILDYPDIIFSFTTRLNDEIIDEARPWYNIVSICLFDVRSVFLNESTCFGGSLFSFNLPDYDEDGGSTQSSECFNDITHGLKSFQKIYNETNDFWYLKFADIERIELKHIPIN